MSLKGLFLGFRQYATFFTKYFLEKKISQRQLFSDVSSAEKNCFRVSGKTLSGFFGTV